MDNGNVSKNEVKAMLGNMAHDDILPLIEAIAAKTVINYFRLLLISLNMPPDFQQV